MDVDDIRFKVAASRRIMFRADLEAARFHVLAAGIGGTPFADNPSFLTRKVPHRANLPLLWDAHLRRLQRTDPDLFAGAEAIAVNA
jgi:hypothetical protein